MTSLIPALALILAVAILLTYAVILELRKRSQIPPLAPNPPVNPCAFYHDIKPLAVDHVDFHGNPHTSVVYRCERCSTHISVMYNGTFQLPQLMQNQADAIEEWVKR